MTQVSELAPDVDLETPIGDVTPVDGEERKFVHGFDPDLMGTTLETLTVDVGEFREGGLNEGKFTIMGFGEQKGGETKETTRNGKKETFKTTDQLEIYLRIDNPEELDIDYDTTTLFLGLPKMSTGPDGRPRRQKPVQTSKLALWMSAMEAAGVSKAAELASKTQVLTLADYIGLQFHATKVAYPQRDGSSMTLLVAQPDEDGEIIYGYDNDVRTNATNPNTGASLGLAPRYINGQEPEAAAKKGSR